MLEQPHHARQRSLNGHKAPSVATDHTSTGDFYLTHQLHNVCPYLYPIY